MSQNLTDTAPEKQKALHCESCGNEFSCGAENENCWCFDYELSEQTLSNIRENYSKCLCSTCLTNLINSNSQD